MASPPSQSATLIGQELDGYRILAKLGHGGMGIVYQALDLALEREVALKIMNPMLLEDERFLRRFQSEARALGQLFHPHIVGIYTFRHVGQHLFIVMEFIDGGTLADRIRQQGALPMPLALTLMRQTLSALDYAHGKQIIHRDIKPQNILLTKQDEAKISDFGLAKILSPDLQGAGATRTGFTGGTLYYMPPEQLEGLTRTDHRSDIYSLGMTFYEMLAGRPPFDKSSSEFAILRAIDAHDFPPLTSFNPEVPTTLCDVITRMIEKDPDDRFQTATSAAEALERALSPAAVAPPPAEEPPPTSTFVLHPVPAPEPTPPTRPWRPSPKVLAAGVVALLLVAAVVLFQLFSGSTPAGPAAPSRVVLAIESVPAGARVLLDGVAVGETPLARLEAEVGTRTLRLEKDGFAALDTTVAVAAGTDPTLRFAMAEADPESETATTGSLTIRSAPTGAEVLLDGQRQGRTPMTLEGIPPGAHRLTLRHDGYADYARALTITPGAREDVRATLAARTAPANPTPATTAAPTPTTREPTRDATPPPATKPPPTTQPPAAATPAQTFTLPSNVAVRFRPRRAIRDGSGLNPGATITVQTDRAVRMGGVTLIERGATVTVRVEAIGRNFIEFTPLNVQAVDGQSLRLATQALRKQADGDEPLLSTSDIFLAKLARDYRITVR